MDTSLTKTHLHYFLSADVSEPPEDVHDPVRMGLPFEQSQEVDWKNTAHFISVSITSVILKVEQLCTVLGEFGGGELGGDPESLLGAALEDEAGGNAGATVKVLFTAGQAQVEGVVTEGGVLVTLRRRQTGEELKTVSLCSISCTDATCEPCRRRVRGSRQTEWFHPLSSEA